MARSKGIVFLLPLMLGGCKDQELIQLKNKEIDTLKSHKIALTAELEGVRDSLKVCQAKNKDAHHTIEELHKALQQTYKTEQILPEKKDTPAEISQKPEGKTS